MGCSPTCCENGMRIAGHNPAVCFTISEVSYPDNFGSFQAYSAKVRRVPSDMKTGSAGQDHLAHGIEPLS